MAPLAAVVKESGLVGDAKRLRLPRFDGLLTMARLVEPLMGVTDPGNVRNWRVAKSRIVLIPIPIILILITPVK